MKRADWVLVEEITGLKKLKVDMELKDLSAHGILGAADSASH